MIWEIIVDSEYFYNFLTFNINHAKINTFFVFIINRTFRGHLQCVHGIVRTTCGQQTEEFASQFLSQMSSPLLVSIQY